MNLLQRLLGFEEKPVLFSLPLEEKEKLAQLEASLGYTFKDATLLKRALSHKSYVNENRLPATEHNERYEFLGDAVLELAISDLMMRLFPESSEGDLSKLRAATVNEQSLAEIARTIHLGQYLFLGRGENQAGREKDSLVADAFEAVMGAIYLDGGFDPAKEFVHRHFGKLLQKATKKDISRDFKTRLQEISQDKFQLIPQYRLVKESGPDHDKQFDVELFINKELYGKGFGKSKKQAEQNAAFEAIKKIEGLS